MFNKFTILSGFVKSRRNRKMIYQCLRWIFRKEMWCSYVQYPDGKCIRLDMGKDKWHQDYCADPFVFAPKGGIGDKYLFYETLDRNDKGIIGCFKEENGIWRQLGKVLECDYHVSYPQVFEDNGDIYMIPESCANGVVDLFRAIDFPCRWEKVKTLVPLPSVDSTLLKKDGEYFLALMINGKAELWMSDSLFGEWRRHPQFFNVNQSRRLRRNGGAFFSSETELYRIAQDCNGAYGKRVFRVPIIKLSRSEYKEGMAELLLDGNRLSNVCGGGRHTYNVFGKDKRLIVFDEQEYRRRHAYEVVKNILSLVIRLIKKVAKHV